MNDRFIWKATDIEVQPTATVTAGEGPGHPFRGNQYVDGESGSGEQAIPQEPHAADLKGPNPILNPPPALAAAFAKLTPEQRERLAKVQATVDLAQQAGQETKAKYFDPATGQYQPERAAQHQAIVDAVFANTEDIPNDHQAILMGGLGGAGKSSLLRSGAPDTHYADDLITQEDGTQVTAEQLFGVTATAAGASREEGARITNFMDANADRVKEMMIERGMNPQIAGLNPMESAGLLHEESSDISKMIAARAIAEGKNFIYDVTLGSVSSGADKIGTFHDHGYQVKLAYVSTTPETSIAQALFRWARGDTDYASGKGQGGRFVSPRLQLASAQGRGRYRSANEAAFYALIHSTDPRTKPDSYVIIDNENRDRKVIGSG